MKVHAVNDNSILKVLHEPPKDYIDHCGKGVANIKERIHKHKYGHALNDLASDENEDLENNVDNDVYFKPTALVEKGNESAFVFRTPQKSKSLSEKLESDLNIKTPSYSPRSSKSQRLPMSPLARNLSTTPKRSDRNRHNYQTPDKKTLGSKREPQCLEKQPKRDQVKNTPYSFRKNVRKRIAEIVQDDESWDEYESEEDEYCPSGDDQESSEEGFSDDEDAENVAPFQTPNRRKLISKNLLKTPKTPLRTPRRGRKPKVDVDMAASSDVYFERNSDNSWITSDHTLNKLENPRLAPDALKSLLGTAYASHQTERQELVEDHAALFPHWITLMLEGFSVFLCGVGSKKNLLSSFQSEFLADEDHIVINGFFPSLTVRSILSSIIDEIMGLGVHPQSLPDQITLIKSQYHDGGSKRGSDRLFVVVHNLDGPMLRNEKAQAALSQLASLERIHLIASLDHINASLLLDGNKYSAYNPLWWDATTLAPYAEETSYENSIMVQQSGALVLSSLIHVFRSLNPNAKGIFLTLANHQLSEKNNSHYIGLPFNDLYNKCREKFLVNSDVTLRAQLTEFRDHKLIKMKKGVDGQENLIIPVQATALQEFLDQLEEQENL